MSSSTQLLFQTQKRCNLKDLWPKLGICNRNLRQLINTTINKGLRLIINKPQPIFISGEFYCLITTHNSTCHNDNQGCVYYIGSHSFNEVNATHLKIKFP